MRKWRYLARLAVFVSATLMTWARQPCPETELQTSGIEENGYTVPFPVQQAGEKIDVLVRIRDMQPIYRFNLIFVERKEWHRKKRDELMRIFSGHAPGDWTTTPYPFKLRIRIDLMDEVNHVHIDEIVVDRDDDYLPYAEKNGVTWRKQRIYANRFMPGIYRVRVDNLVALPQIDFDILFMVEHSGHRCRHSPNSLPAVSRPLPLRSEHQHLPGTPGAVPANEPFTPASPCYRSGPGNP